METYEPAVYRGFKRMNSGIIPGAGPKMLMAALVGLVVGLMAFALMGIPQHEVTRALDPYASNELTGRARDQVYALQYERALEVNKGKADALQATEATRNSYLPGYSDEEVATLAQEGREAGFTADTPIQTAMASVDTNVVVSEPALPMVARVVVAGLFPLAGAFLFFEFSGASLMGETEQRIRNRRAIKVYEYRSR